MESRGIGVRHIRIHNKTLFRINVVLSWGRVKSIVKSGDGKTVIDWVDLGGVDVGLPNTKNFKVNIQAAGGVTKYVEENEYFYNNTSKRVLEVTVTGSPITFQLRTVA